MQSLDPLEVTRDSSPPPPPSPRPRRMPPRRLSAHVYPPDWLHWMKQSPGARRFSIRKHSAGRTSTKSNDDGEGNAQTNIVPEFDATSSIPLTTLSPPGSPTTPITSITPSAPTRRHSNAWHFLHSIVSNSSSVSSPSGSTDATSQPSSSPASDSPLTAMAQQMGQGSPVEATSALPGEAIAVPELPPAAISESPAPSSAHDAVVNKLLNRPPIIHRSNSTPVPESAFGPGMYRTLSGTRTPNDPERARDQTPSDAMRDSPLSTLLRGPLDASGGGVTRALGSHIEAVLSAQVEIGRAHLALEGIGAPKPARLDLVNSTSDEGEDAAERAAEADDADEADLLRRQQGVEELMAKLSTLATSIKSYHAIGTPALIFPPAGLPHQRHAVVPALHDPKAGLPRVAIAMPNVARNESLPTSAGSVPVPVPGLRIALPKSTTSSTSVQSPVSPPPISAPAAAGRRGMHMWFRKSDVMDSPTELSPIERDADSIR
ncbi:hypothetical protein CspHIS471_0508560 [Cutaneotrichosporon sp. HIS471]|nr:hypothetical protein CspHIS471_0508560 [Cutaneotrichosporon sp. HIS471]